MVEAGHNSGNRLVVRLHPADNVVTARLDMLANTGIAVSYTHLTLPTKA